MSNHRNPRQRLSKQPSPDNFDPGLLISLLYEDLVEVEALAITADEAVTMLPPRPSGKYGRTMAGSTRSSARQPAGPASRSNGARSWLPCARPS